MTGRRRGRDNERADGDTHAHNTLSPDNTDVQVFYPFHPLHGATLRILRRPKRGDGAVCVMDPAGRRLKIPVWMLSRECAEIVISEQPHLGKECDRIMRDQVIGYCLNRLRKNPLPEPVSI